MPTRKQQRYRRKLDEIFSRYERVEDQTIRLLIGQLQELRKGIAGSLITIDPASFEAARLQQLQLEVGASIDQFRQGLGRELAGNLEQIYEIGGLSVIEPLAAAGITVPYIPDIAQLNAITGFSADLIQNISEPMRQTINTQIRLSLFGGQSPYKTMQNITNILGLKAYDGVWGIRHRPDVVKGIAARAETILRTETTRALNIAIHSQQREVAKEQPILKTWIATGDARTRITHLRAHTRYNDEPIPINQPFVVGGAEIMYPGDPAGPPSETVNCRCRSTTFHPEIGVLSGPVDTAIAAQAKQREKA